MYSWIPFQWADVWIYFYFIKICFSSWDQKWTLTVLQGPWSQLVLRVQQFELVCILPVGLVSGVLLPSTALFGHFSFFAPRRADLPHLPCSQVQVRLLSSSQGRSQTFFSGVAMVTQHLGEGGGQGWPSMHLSFFVINNYSSAMLFDCYCVKVMILIDVYCKN